MSLQFLSLKWAEKREMNTKSFRKYFKTACYILKILLRSSSIFLEFTTNFSIWTDKFLFWPTIIFSWAKDILVKCTQTHIKQIIEMTLIVTDAINVRFDSNTIMNLRKFWKIINNKRKILYSRVCVCNFWLYALFSKYFSCQTVS